MQWACLALLRILISFPSSCITPKSWQKHEFLAYLIFKWLSWPEQRISSIFWIHPKHFCHNLLSKNSSKQISPKKFLPENSKKNPKKIRKISKKILKKLLRFWKYPIPYIAIRGRTPFRAFFIFRKQKFTYGPHRQQCNSNWRLPT